MKSKLLLSFALVIIGLSACKKAKDDVSSPVITIRSPLKDTGYSAEDSLFVDVVVEDEDLHDFRLTIRKYNDTGWCCTVLDIKRHSHDQLVTYQRRLAPQEPGLYNISVSAIDHNGNDSSLGHDFTVE
jgi:hypothetical protein